MVFTDSERTRELFEIFLQESAMDMGQNLCFVMAIPTIVGLLCGPANDGTPDTVRKGVTDIFNELRDLLVKGIQKAQDEDLDTVDLGLVVREADPDLGLDQLRIACDVPLQQAMYISACIKYFLDTFNSKVDDLC